MLAAPSEVLIQKAEKILYGSKVGDGPYEWNDPGSSKYPGHMSLKVEALRGEGYGEWDPAVAVVDHQAIGNMKEALMHVSQRDGLFLKIDTERAPRVFIDRSTFDRKMPALMEQYRQAQPPAQ